jgi:hypothetical protein
MKTLHHITIARRTWIALSAAIAFASCLAINCYAAALMQQQSTPASTTSRHIGAIKSINGTVITLTPDSGPDVNLTLQPNTRLLRVAPGEKDLKNATPIQSPDLQVGDRILVAAKPSDDNSSLVATTVIVMSHSAITARNQQELDDWQKRGVDGTVNAIDPPAGTVTISTRGKSVLIQTSKTTIIRRYAPDSVKFDEAKPSTLSEVHPGDQVRARGDRNSDGTQLTADEIVSGTFRNIAGTVNSADASSSTLNVHDLLSNKNVTVKITKDSQLHQLPPEMAQRIAARLKRTGTPGAPASASDSPASGQSDHAQGNAGPTNAADNGAPRRAPDLQQILSRTPTVSLNDLHKGDAIIVLSTEGVGGVGTIITLLTGVDPILQAAPNASGASILTPWSLGAPSGDAGGP